MAVGDIFWRDLYDQILDTWLCEGPVVHRDSPVMESGS